ncbi:MAG: phosphatidylserine decarboxylase family protein [Bacteroidales bacterium]|nr:phosphatidylserine decarboxylase family protein [Bacteroidales bacterium]MBR5054052.1 phosphatidylserine decarboxylase family protein [Bacteroidales bacterium]
MHIDHNSYGSVALAYIIGAIAIILFRLIFHNPWVFWVLTAIVLMILFWQTLFFRVPDREKAGSGDVVTAVADGRIVINEKVFEPEFLHRECIQVSIYMNFFDVHANFWPVDGVVTYYKYHPGEHFLAFKPKASEENEHACTAIRTDGGKDMMFKQLAGTFARRIVCYSEPGMRTTAGEQCGIIKFGSRIDMFFPTDADIKVKIGDKVRACESVIALL